MKPIYWVAEPHPGLCTLQHTTPNRGVFFALGRDCVPTQTVNEGIRADVVSDVLYTPITVTISLGVTSNTCMRSQHKFVTKGKNDEDGNVFFFRP